MKLQNLLGADLKLSMDAIAVDKELSSQIQIRLIDVGLLRPPADGLFGAISADSLKQFQELTNCGESGFLGAKTAEKLIEAKPENVPQPKLKLENNFVGRILKYMQTKNYQIDMGYRKYNIVYVEGVNADGTVNDDTPNKFNDRRLVIDIIGGIPKILGNWEGTTEPGSKYTYKPQNEFGAARIKFGQYKAWQVGIHKAGTLQAHEALVQVESVSVCRDFNKDFKRTGDKIDTGIFGINQHWGFDFPTNDIRGASAGCLVGRSTQSHKDFMELIKQDNRYRANRNYTFVTTVIPGDEL